MRSRSRAKHTGRYESGKHFARIPAEVLGSEAWHAIPDWGRGAVIGVAAQFRGGNNGDLALTWPSGRDLGIGSQWKLRGGLKLGLLTGLLILTRPGGNVAGGQKLPSLYALGWESIPPSDKFEVAVTDQLKARNGWAHWTRPDDWRAVVVEVRRRAQGKKWRHTREEQAATPGGIDSTGNRASRVCLEEAATATHGLVTSIDLGGITDVDERAIALMREHAHLADFDIARALRWRIEPHRVRALRAASL